MRVILIGASGQIGKHVYQTLADANADVIPVGKSTGQLQVNIESPSSILELYKKVERFDAVVNASGHVEFAPLSNLTEDQWAVSFRSKLLGQINLVQLGIPYISEGGSFTLVSGILGDEQIKGGVIAATVNKALEGFVAAAATELPKNLRLNLVSPTLLEESVPVYGPYFPGFQTVKGSAVGLAFKKAVMGVQTGKILKVN